MPITTPTRAPVRTELRGHVLVVTIDRYRRRNAIDRATADGLDAAFNRMDDDPDVWCAILTGERVFSAGSDLTANGDYVTDRGDEYGLIRRQRSTPLIAGHRFRRRRLGRGGRDGPRLGRRRRGRGRLPGQAPAVWTGR